MRSEGNGKVQTEKPSNLNLRRKLRGRPSWKQEAGSCESACDTKRRSGERDRRKLSTGIGRAAWKQAGRKRKGSGPRGTGAHGQNHRQGWPGRRERKDGRLSSQNRVEAEKTKRRRGESPEAKRTRGSGEEGKHRWNSCGSEAGRGERKRTGSQVPEPGRKAWETRLDGTGRAEEARAEAVHWGSP